MASVSERLREAMAVRNMRQADLVKLTGIGKSSVSTYLSGDYKPKQENIYKMARVLGVSAAWLMGRDVPMKAEPLNAIPVSPDTEYVKIPVADGISADGGFFGGGGYENVPKEDIDGGGSYVYMRVSGDGMYPVIMENDLALVRMGGGAENGSYAVVSLDGGDGVIKRIERGGGFITLQSVNPMYPPVRFDGADAARVRVLGSVKEIKRKF